MSEFDHRTQTSFTPSLGSTNIESNRVSTNRHNDSTLPPTATSTSTHTRTTITAHASTISHQQVPFPTFHAGELGASNEWHLPSSATSRTKTDEPTSSSLSSSFTSTFPFPPASTTSTSTSASAASTNVASSSSHDISSALPLYHRHTVDDLTSEAMRSSQPLRDANHRIDPLLSKASEKDWKETEQRVLTSLDSDTATIANARLLSHQYQHLLLSSHRKDEQIMRLESQISDLTRVIEAQQRRREHDEAIRAEQQARAANEANVIEQIRKDFEKEHTTRLRFEHEMALEHQAHDETKKRLVEAMHRHELELRQVGQELTRREAELRVEIDAAATMRDELQHRVETLERSDLQQQDRIRTLEAQLRQTKQEKNEIEMKTKAVTADTEYLARELSSLKQQYDIRDDTARSAEQNLQKQKSQLDQLTKEISSLRTENATLRTENTALRDDLSHRPTPSEYSDLRHQLAQSQASLALSEDELKAQLHLVHAARQDVTALEAKLATQANTVAELQARHVESMSREVERNELKSHLTQTTAELETTKTRLETVQGALQEANRVIRGMDEELTDAQRQQADLRRRDDTWRQMVEARHRTFRMLQQQLRQMCDKNPFHDTPTAKGRDSHEIAVASSSSTDLELVPSSSSSSPQSLDHDFTQLRDSVNTLLRDLHAHTRLAFNMYTENQSALVQAQEESASHRSQLQTVQRQLADATLEATSRYQTLEQQYFRVEQDLMLVRNDLDEQHTHEQQHRRQLQSIWNGCVLLIRAYKPLHARYTDLIAQKDWLQKEVNRLQTVVLEVYQLRRAMTSFEETTRGDDKSGSTGNEVDVIDSAAHRHPYRLHSCRQHVSLRACVIGVIGARRLWRSSERRYGTLIDVGTELVIMTPSPTAAGAGTLASNSNWNEAQSTSREKSTREMVLPHIDQSTIENAGVSLVKLIQHFEQQNGNNLSAGSGRSRRSQVPSLLKRLIDGYKAFSHTHPSSSSSAISRSPLGDVAKIRSVSVLLAERVREFHHHWRTAQNEIVHLVRQSERTGEALAHEQQRAHDLLRHHTEMARHAEESSNSLIAALRQQLADAEKELRTKHVTSEEYSELHATSEMVLQQCQELEQRNRQLNQKLHDSKVIEERLLQEKVEKDATIAMLKQVMEEKQKTLTTLDAGVRSDLQSVQLELNRALQLQQEREHELAQARQIIQALQLSHSQLELDRSSLISAHDDTQRELVRVQGVLRTISQAGQAVKQQQQQQIHNTPPTTTTTITSATTATSSTRMPPVTSLNASLPTIRMPPPLPYSTIALASPAPSSSFTPASQSLNLNSTLDIIANTGGVNNLPTSSSTATSSTSSQPPVGSIKVRHHPSGQLSIDFGSSIAVPQQSTTNTLDNEETHPLAHTYKPSASIRRGPTATNFTTTPYTSLTFSPSSSPYPPMPSSTASARSFSARERDLLTPVRATAKSPMRVKFASDTKA